MKNKPTRTTPHNHIMAVTAALLAAGIAGSATCRAVATRYYRFETQNQQPVSVGQTLTTADDSSGNNRSGLAMGSPTYVSSPFLNPIPRTGAANNSSLLLGVANGHANAQGVLLQPDTSPVLASTFTVEAVFRLNSTDPNTGDVKAIFKVQDSASLPFGLSVFNINDHGGTDDLLLYMNNDTAEIGVPDLAVGRNYFVAVTYDGSTASLYLDNSLIGSVYAPGFNGTGSMTGAIGNDSYLIGSPFQGNIDEFRISDVALTPDQFLNVVPEPSSGLLLVLGLFGFLWVRHRGDPRPAR